MADLPVYYWDACILLEHFREEVVAPTKVRAIQRLLSENKAKENRIMTSVMTHVEVLPKKLTETDSDNEAKYWSYYDGIHFLDVEVSRNILILARDLKDFYYEPSDHKTGANHRMLGTGDAVHLATAIIYKVTEFHTRDGKRHGGNVPLLGLAESSPNGKIAGKWPLKIVSPEDAQTDLLDPRPTSAHGSSKRRLNLGAARMRPKSKTT